MLNNDAKTCNVLSAKELGLIVRDESGEIVGDINWCSTFHDKLLVPSVRMELRKLGIQNFKTALWSGGEFAKICKVCQDDTIYPLVLKLFQKPYALHTEYHTYLSDKISTWKMERGVISNYLLEYHYYPNGYLNPSEPQKESPFALMETASNSSPLDIAFISKHLRTDLLISVKDDFLKLMRLFDVYEIGHGDLSPDNIMIQIDEIGNPHIKLIDYDDLYIPGFGKPVFTTESGKPAFQHKSRNIEKALDKTVHYFSSIVIYLSLLVYSLRDGDSAYSKAYGDFISKIDPNIPEYEGETDEMRKKRKADIRERRANVIIRTDAKYLLFEKSNLTDKKEDAGEKKEINPFKKLVNYRHHEICELAKILEIYIQQETTEHFQSLPYLVDMIRKQDSTKVYTYSMRPGSPIYRE